MLFKLASPLLLWTICFLTQAQDITFVFKKCHLLRFNLLFQPVKMLLNPDSVIPCISYLPELVVSHRFDNRPSLSSSKSMIKILKGPSQGKSIAAGSPPSWGCCVYLNFFQPAENLLNHINISHMTLSHLKIFGIWSLLSPLLLSSLYS